jgi:2-phospho-L-lactate guanylyltransferase
VSLWAVVVARTGHTAKSRLASELSPDRRARLARAMLADVLAACRRAGLSELLVVTETAAGRAAAERHGARVLADPGAGLNGAVAAAARLATDAGAGALLVLPGDVPLASPAELQTLVQAADGLERVLVAAPDTAGLGTNALLLRPPTLVAPAYGEASLARHLAAAEALGAPARCLALPGLAQDVDTPDQLAALRASAPPGSAVGRLLARLAVA